jgi:hypothetical protein
VPFQHSKVPKYTIFFIHLDSNFEVDFFIYAFCMFTSFYIALTVVVTNSKTNNFFKGHVLKKDALVLCLQQESTVIPSFGKYSGITVIV